MEENTVKDYMELRLSEAAIKEITEVRDQIVKWCGRNVTEVESDNLFIALAEQRIKGRSDG